MSPDEEYIASVNYMDSDDNDVDLYDHYDRSPCLPMTGTSLEMMSCKLIRMVLRNTLCQVEYDFGTG